MSLVRAFFVERSRPLRALTRLVPLQARDAVVHRLMCSDRASRRNLKAAFEGRASGDVPVRLRALGGRQFWIRAHSDDPWVIRETVTYTDCLPPPDLPEPSTILDLGANIGASMALMATMYPHARIVGVEPDPANATLCRRNVAPWADRCEVIEAAAWPTDGTVTLGGQAGATRRVAATGAEVRAIALATVLDEWTDGYADFAKLDVEGSEQELLRRETGWMARVGCVSVEVHPPYTGEQCRRDLEAAGFEVREQRASRGPRLVGVRPRT